MATNTYVALDKVTVGTAVSFATFSSIPATYTDLVIVANGNTSALVDTYLRFNGDSTSGLYSTTRLYGNGSTATSDRYANQNHILSGDFNTTSDTSTIFQIQNYSNASTFKTSLIRSNYAGSILFANVGLWRNTAAITSVTISTSSGTFAVGSTFSLYGIASEGAAYATGGYVTSDANYYYHTFTASGTFTPKQSLTADYLVVAGGGAGGGNPGGGGGAGGLRSTVDATGGGGSLESALSLSAATNYAVTIGGGGTAPGPSINPTKGTDSVFSTITSLAGGVGKSNLGSSAENGGSGGGGNYANTSAGTGTANQGYNGGAGVNNATLAAGGGGGAGAVGAIGATNSGAGGIGVQTSISGTATYYAGGGGGGPSVQGAGAGAGGLGGGGTGGPNNGTVNTGGGGGGGSGATGLGGAGGSGIVIVRYAK